MWKVVFKVIIVLCWFGVCACAHAEDIWTNDYIIYWVDAAERWVDVDDTDKRVDRLITTSSCNRGSHSAANIGYGYLLEGNTENDVYYAVMRDKDRWDICEVGASIPTITLVYPDIIRILAYQNETVFYITSKYDKPILISLNNDHESICYPYGKYSEEFDLSGDYEDEDEWAKWGIKLDDRELEGIKLMYTTTVSEDGKIAYCIEDYDYTPPIKCDSAIYVTTPNQADIYIGEGSHPAWLDENSLLYIGNDSKLYQYSMVEETSQLYVSDKKEEIVMPPVDPMERMVVIDKDHIGYIQICDKQNKLTLLSLRTGKSHIVDTVTPFYFMDAIIRIISVG